MVRDPKHNEIIRFETYSGRGIYNGLRSEFRDDLEAHGLCLQKDHHKSPHRDMMLQEQMRLLIPRAEYADCGFNNFIFGFSNWAQASRWIYDDRISDVMRKYRVYCAIYEGEVIHGEAQAMVRNFTKRRTEIIPLIEVERKFSCFCRRAPQRPNYEDIMRSLDFNPMMWGPLREEVISITFEVLKETEAMFDGL